MHRRILALVVIAVASGVGVGLLFGIGHVAVGLTALVLVGVFVVPWLAFVATWRILGPMRRLARVADAMGRGHLEAGDDLDASDASDEELAPVAGALRGLADRIQRQLDDQRSLMGAVSHELRSPLARARVLVEMSREGTAPDDLADRMEREIALMDGIVGDLLAASRIDFDAVQRRVLDPVDVALAALERAGVSEDRLLVTEDPGMVDADPTLLGRALGVMLRNAEAHGHGVVTLVVDRTDDRVVLKVLDDGPGFAEGDAERAFEPFWRAGGEGAPRGEGLGLALVRRIAETHGGTASAGNRARGGAWVRLSLPAVEEE